MSRKHHGRGIGDLPEDLPGSPDTEPRSQGAPRKNGPVLLVGNDPDLLVFLREVLAGQGFRVIVSSRMSAALVAVLRYRPAVVCLADLPGCGADLPEFIALLPASPNQKRVPVIIMTACAAGERKPAETVPGFVPGYDAYLPKPALSGEILDCVRRAIRLT
ncbi:MAG: hypothetical protein NTY77_08860 [Elusimicrobia bacterium]|nr:hypothetical protein [Elusimicrobiota bacterium]